MTDELRAGDGKTSCLLCGRALNQPDDPASLDCGGDCWGCIEQIEKEGLADNEMMDENHVVWEILGTPSDFCGEMYAELQNARGERTVRLAGQLRAAGYEVPEREVEDRPVREGDCIKWSGEEHDTVPEEQPVSSTGEDTRSGDEGEVDGRSLDFPEQGIDKFRGMVEVAPDVYAFAEHE